jgi:hypothetical protein
MILLFQMRMISLANLAAKLHSNPEDDWIPIPVEWFASVFSGSNIKRLETEFEGLYKYTIDDNYLCYLGVKMDIFHEKCGSYVIVDNRYYMITDGLIKYLFLQIGYDYLLSVLPPSAHRADYHARKSQTTLKIDISG